VVPENFKESCELLKSEGIILHFGKWLINGNPKAILIDFASYAANKDRIKTDYWDSFKIDSLGTSYFDYEEPVVWATAVGRVLEELSSRINGKIVAHFHEWLAGAGILYLKRKENKKIATVFTTHATILGRTMASSNIDIYGLLGKMNPEDEAKKYGIQAKYMTEKASCHNADAFTTVSEITSIEAEHLLQKKADVLLPNGLNMGQFPTFEEISIKHHYFKNQIMEFLLYYFFPYYSFDLDNTLFYFICGRYEFHDKGIDVFIKALSKLNQRLRKEGSKKTIVSFFWIPGNIRSIKPALLENKTKFRDVKDTIDEVKHDIVKRVLHNTISGEEINKDSIFFGGYPEELKRKVFRLKRKGKPLLATHDLNHEEKDEILNNFKQHGLTNNKEDNVKVVFYSIYLTGSDSLLDTSYYESMLGAHLGVFASYYEPWGYTPLEAGALGVPSVTTDLAGFGRYIKGNIKGNKTPGIYVLNRFGKNEAEIVENLGNMLYDYAHLTKDERVKSKIEAKRLSSFADWNKLVVNYIKAHNLACERKFGGN